MSLLEYSGGPLTKDNYEVTLQEYSNDYPEKTVHLKFFLCRLAKGEPRAIGCAAYEWATRESLAKRDFPPADDCLLGRLVDSEPLWR